MNRHGEDEACVLWCGGLADDVTEELLFELMMQAGPVERVTRPKGKNFAFILYKHKESVGYALKVLDGVELFGRRLMMRQREVRQDRDRSNDSRDSNRESRRRSQSPPLWKEDRNNTPQRHIRFDGGRHGRQNDNFVTPPPHRQRNNGGGGGWGRYDQQYGTPQDHRGRTHDRSHYHDRSSSAPQHRHNRSGYRPVYR